MRVHSAFAPQVAAYHALSPARDLATLRLQWGVLADLAGKVFRCGADAVDFEWAERGVELHARYADAGFRRVSRYVIFTLGDEDGEVLFSDAHHVLRGWGRLAADGSIWFKDRVAATGCTESGAIYTLTDGRFERQRFLTRDIETEMLRPACYEPVQSHRGHRLSALSA